MHMHTKERTFTCPYKGCSKSFCEREGLTQHESSHTNKNIHRCGYESCNKAFDSSFKLHRHYREEHDKTTTPVEEVRPIRLRLTQPKKQESIFMEDIPRKRILLRLPMKKTLGGLSTPDPTEGHKDCSESNSPAERSIKDTGRRNAHKDAHSTNSSLSTSSKASGNNHISSHTSCADGGSSGGGVSVYTSVCGVYSREKAPPDKDTLRTGPYHCPRCETQFTRPRSVKRHFVGCITRYGNPDSLKWTDHMSLWRTIRYYARNESHDHGYDLSPLAADVQKKSRELPNGALLHPLASKPLSSIIEEDIGSVKPVYKPPGRAALLSTDIVRPIQRRRDALRRSNYNPETIARDILLATGRHPSMDPLNAHLDMLQKRFRVVNLESNMSLRDRLSRK